jgi:outer membrane receptor for ferrienterochelin and colicins
MHYQLWIATRRSLWKHPLLLEVNGYYQHVNQKIALAQDATGTQYSYFNLDRFEATGLQASVDYRPGNHQFKAGFAYVGTESNLTLNGFAYTPEVTASASFVWKQTGLTFSGFYKYTGRVQVYLKTDDGTPKSSFMADYHLLDVSVSRPFWNKLIVLTAGGKNLFDVRSVVTGNATGIHSGGGGSAPVAWGRSLYLKVQLNLHHEKK